MREIPSTERLSAVEGFVRVTGTIIQQQTILKGVYSLLWLMFSKPQGYS
jgi:hypothetical protein